MTTGIDLFRNGDKVVRTLVIGMKCANGGVMILKSVTSILPDWPTNHKNVPNG